MPGRNDPIFIDHDSPLEYKLSKREVCVWRTHPDHGERADTVGQQAVAKAAVIDWRNAPVLTSSSQGPTA